jgi:hypothetical protein
VEKEITPVLGNMISALSATYTCSLIVYKHKKIFSFLRTSIRLILTTRGFSAIFFIGIQSLPLLCLVQFLRVKKYYWALENYSFRLFNSTLSQKTLAFEYFIKWKNIFLIFPSEHRARILKYRNFKKSFIIENTSFAGNSFSPRSLNHGALKLVMYGRLNDADIYLNELIKACGKHSEHVELHLIGWDFLFSDEIKKYPNIFYHGKLGHSDLLLKLAEMDASVIGYRPYKLNNKYCAPNKLYESLSLSLPVIVNSLNPPLDELVRMYKVGVSVDFSRIDSLFTGLTEELKSSYPSFNRLAFEAYSKQFHFENYASNVINSISS